MIIPPVDKFRKQAIELSMAQIDPNASFADRVAQFDAMEALAKKRKKVTIILIPKLPYERTFQSKFPPNIFLAVNNTPEDVVEFLEDIFDKPLHTWHLDPGYATRIVGMCPPPSNSKVLVGEIITSPLPYRTT
jgi:hypothetical protein